MAGGEMAFQGLAIAVFAIFAAVSGWASVTDPGPRHD